MSRRLVVKLAVDDCSAERLQTGLSVAAAAVAGGVETSLWLAGEASRLAVASHPIDAEVEQLLAPVLDGGRVTVCARCASRRGITADHLRSGAIIAGAAAFVAEVTQPDAQALVY